MPLTEQPPPRGTRFANILARLLELPNYSWDSDIKPFHSVSHVHARVPSWAKIRCYRAGRQLTHCTVLRQLALLRPPEGIACSRSPTVSRARHPHLAIRLALPRLAPPIARTSPTRLWQRCQRRHRCAQRRTSCSVPRLHPHPSTGARVPAV
jgi:hypothetical protein